MRGLGSSSSSRCACHQQPRGRPAAAAAPRQSRPRHAAAALPLAAADSSSSSSRRSSSRSSSSRACDGLALLAGQHQQHTLGCRLGRRRHTALAAASDGADSSSGSGSDGGGGSGGTGTVEPFSEADLAQLTREEGWLEEEALGEAWRENFEGDLEGLYDYVDRDQMELAAQVEALHSVPKHLWDSTGMLDELSKFAPGLVADVMGMGTWRLKGMVDEVFEFLVTRIEASLRELLNTDLALYPVAKWKERGWDFIDSCDPQRELLGFSYVDMPDPMKGAEGYPRLLIENRVYSSRVFRKLHLEVARRQDGLQVLHMVFYPRYDFDLPILALDLVAAGGAVTLAVIDACPLSARLSLPQHYAETMAELQATFLPESLLSSEGRTIPAWGAAIFSPLCLCIKPQDPEELAGFMKYAVALVRAHLMYSRLLEPVRPTSKPGVRRLRELLAAQQRFCEQQLSNTKTSRVLDVAFEPEFTQAYMRELMFDYAPTEDVPWFDGSLAQLYSYFEDNPEIWTNAQEFMTTKLALDGAKASDYLRRFLAGDASIKLPRLSFAMQHMYDTDPDFQSAVDRWLLQQPPEDVPDEADMGQYLAQQFMDLSRGGDGSSDGSGNSDGDGQPAPAAGAPAAPAAAAAAAAAEPATAKEAREPDTGKLQGRGEQPPPPAPGAGGDGA